MHYDDELNIERTAEHVRFTWACVGDDKCADHEHPWTAEVESHAAAAAVHAVQAGHESIVIRESRQVTTIARKGH